MQELTDEQVAIPLRHTELAPSYRAWWRGYNSLWQVPVEELPCLSGGIGYDHITGDLVGILS